MPLPNQTAATQAQLLGQQIQTQQEQIRQAEQQRQEQIQQLQKPLQFSQAQLRSGVQGYQQRQAVESQRVGAVGQAQAEYGTFQKAAGSARQELATAQGQLDAYNKDQAEWKTAYALAGQEYGLYSAQNNPSLRDKILAIENGYKQDEAAVRYEKAVASGAPMNLQGWTAQQTRDFEKAMSYTGQAKTDFESAVSLANLPKVNISQVKISEPNAVSQLIAPPQNVLTQALSKSVAFNMPTTISPPKPSVIDIAKFVGQTALDYSIPGMAVKSYEAAMPVITEKAPSWLGKLVTDDFNILFPNGVTLNKGGQNIIRPLPKTSTMQYTPMGKPVTTVNTFIKSQPSKITGEGLGLGVKTGIQLGEFAVPGFYTASIPYYAKAIASNVGTILSSPGTFSSKILPLSEQAGSAALLALPGISSLAKRIPGVLGSLSKAEMEELSNIAKPKTNAAGDITRFDLPSTTRAAELRNKLITGFEKKGDTVSAKAVADLFTPEYAKIRPAIVSPLSSTISKVGLTPSTLAAEQKISALESERATIKVLGEPVGLFTQPKAVPSTILGFGTESGVQFASRAEVKAFAQEAFANPNLIPEAQRAGFIATATTPAKAFEFVNENIQSRTFYIPEKNPFMGIPGYESPLAFERIEKVKYMGTPGEWSGLGEGYTKSRYGKPIERKRFIQEVKMFPDLAKPESITGKSKTMVMKVLNYGKPNERLAPESIQIGKVNYFQSLKGDGVNLPKNLEARQYSSLVGNVPVPKEYFKMTKGEAVSKFRVTEFKEPIPSQKQRVNEIIKRYPSNKEAGFVELGMRKGRVSSSVKIAYVEEKTPFIRMGFGRTGRVPKSEMPKFIPDATKELPSAFITKIELQKPGKQPSFIITLEPSPKTPLADMISSSPKVLKKVESSEDIITSYHGTDTTSAAKILKQGLKPAKNIGISRGVGNIRGKSPLTLEEVYTTPDANRAEGWAGRAVFGKGKPLPGSKPVVLQADIPRGAFDKLLVRRSMEKGGGVEFALKKIPAKYLKEYKSIPEPLQIIPKEGEGLPSMVGGTGLEVGSPKLSATQLKLLAEQPFINPVYIPGKPSIRFNPLKAPEISRIGYGKVISGLGIGLSSIKFSSGKSIQTPMLDLNQQPQLKVGQIPMLETVQQPALETLQLPMLSSIVVPELKIETTQIPIVEVVLKPRVETITRIVPQNAFTPPTPPGFKTPRPTPPRIIIPTTKKPLGLSYRKRITTKAPTGFTVQVKSRKKFGTPLPISVSKESAFAIGASKVISSASATFKIVPSKLPYRPIGITPTLLQRAVIRPGKQPNTFVQKERLRIISRGEVKEISNVGAAARRSGSSKPKSMWGF